MSFWTDWDCPPPKTLPKLPRCAVLVSYCAALPPSCRRNPFEWGLQDVPELCKNSPLWKRLNTHSKSPLPAQWILIRDQLLTDFLHHGNSFWKTLQCWEMKISHCRLLWLVLKFGISRLWSFFDWLDFLLYPYYFKNKKKITKISLSHYSVSVHILTSAVVYLFSAVVTSRQTPTLIYTVLAHRFL